MKKILILALPIVFLTSCGNDNSSSSSESQSSLIAVENPTGNDGVVTNDQPTKQQPTGPTTKIKFLEEVFDFGNVIYPSENQHTFKFKNTGEHPLIIESAKASCGCTVPNKPDEPIMPGKIGEIDVIFRPKEGQQGQKVTKRVTIKANTVPAETYINISANVLKSMKVGE
ncbi:MAG TPA: DUF1573 domain-containing protein [Crocinitomix sp.]|nr:DUF1573 domain-containing protein [Crocinitomix sp.]